MADTKVSALAEATTLGLTDLILIVQGGSSLKISAETLALKMPSRIVINEASEAPVSGALATNKLVSKLAMTDAGAAYTLAAGTHGMEKQIVAISEESGASTAVVTVTSGAGVATITFSAVGQGCHVKNVDGSWYVLGSNGAVVA